MFQNKKGFGMKSMTLIIKAMPCIAVMLVAAFAMTMTNCKDGEDEQIQIINPCANGHAWGVWNTTTVPTCITTGEGTRVCTRCAVQDTNTTIPIDGSNHDWEITSENPAPTCEEDGFGSGHCKREGCEETIENDVLPALGHDFTGDWVNDDPDHHWKVCKRFDDCEAISGDGTTESAEANHNSNNAQDDDCLVPNECTVCKYVLTIAKANHSFQWATDTPAWGMETEVCADCAAPKPDSGLRLASDMLAEIEAGTFIMGSPDGTNGTTREPDRQDREKQHSVTLTQNFEMSKYLITQGQWEAVMGSENDRLTAVKSGTDYGRGDNFPMYYVNWYDVVEFCNKLSMMEGLTPAYILDGETDPKEWGTKGASWNLIEVVPESKGYRLPTEAQWEYAARGDYPNKATERNTKPFGIGDDGTKITGDMANFDGRYPYDLNHTTPGHYNDSEGIYLGKTTEVGEYPENNYGLHDMHGNLFEWCWDWYGEYDDSEDNEDPAGPTGGTYRVLRGGYWHSFGAVIRSAFRGSFTPSSRFNYIGFRLVRP